MSRICGAVERQLYCRLEQIRICNLAKRSHDRRAQGFHYGFAGELFQVADGAAQITCRAAYQQVYVVGHDYVTIYFK